MEFQTRAQKATYEQVRDWLTELLGRGLEIGRESPCFGARNHSAFVQIALAPINEQETAIRVFAVVVRGVELDPTLLGWLLAQNHEVPMGAFAIDRDGDVIFLQNVMGSLCTRDLLATAVQVVATVADQAGTAIVARWGGERAFEDGAGADAPGQSADPGVGEEGEDAPEPESPAAVGSPAGAPARSADAATLEPTRPTPAVRARERV